MIKIISKNQDYTNLVISQRITTSKMLLNPKFKLKMIYFDNKFSNSSHNLPVLEELILQEFLIKNEKINRKQHE